jgi:threonine synthase
MHYYSTNQGVSQASFREAVLAGLAPDGGLFMPASLPLFPSAFFAELGGLSFQDGCFIGQEIDEGTLRAMVGDAINFEAPLAEVSPGLFSLELFHGPTLAFKDFGARFMARVMSHFVEQAGRELLVLAATSGDTGSAVANGFLNVPNVRVVLLYPSGKVSRVQEMQLTTLGANIVALEVDGVFDDCQRLVKRAFAEPELTRSRLLSSANSINIARLIPQTFYYFRAYAQLPDRRKPLYISVPSGNFGNLSAGLMAKKMGLPVVKFIAATNVNDVVPEYLSSAIFAPRPSRMTISNAMDVGDPSNFARMLELYGHDAANMRQDVFGAAFTDDETRAAMAELHRQCGYVLDPHGAVAYLGLRRFLKENTQSANGIFLETAHPAKFYDIVEEALGLKVALPEILQSCLGKEKRSIKISADFDEFKRFLSGL